MTKLTWDKEGERVFQQGLDHGVLYLPDKTAVAWNGLTSIDEGARSAPIPVYFDGVKIIDIPTSDRYSATLKAYTYPDEFKQFDGFEEIADGVLVDNQISNPFDLSYRTWVLNDTGSLMIERIHILYGLSVQPSIKDYTTDTSNSNLIEFSWSVVGSSMQLNGFKAATHLYIDIDYQIPYLKSALEEKLYGTDTTNPNLPNVSDLVDYLTRWHKITIIDNHDIGWTYPETYESKTWTAIASDDFITIVDEVEGIYTIIGVEADYSDADMFTIKSTD